MTNTFALRVAILRSGLTKREIAKRIRLSETGFRKKVNGNTEFRASEIAALSEALRLSDQEKDVIFFSKDVI